MTFNIIAYHQDTYDTQHDREEPPSSATIMRMSNTVKYIGTIATNYIYTTITVKYAYATSAAKYTWHYVRPNTHC